METSRFHWLNSTILFSLLSCALLLIITITLHFPKKRNPNLPPGPPPLPLIGNLHQLSRLPHLSLHRLAAAYGPIIHLTLGFIPTVVVSSPRIAREVLRTHDLALCSRPRFYSARRLFYDCTDMVFSPYGPYWRHVRKICILELLSTKRVESFEPARAVEVSRMVERVNALVSSGDPVNLSKILGFYANGVLCRTAFGKEFLEGGDYERYGFEKMLEEYQVLLGGLGLEDFYPGMEWVISKVSGKERRLEKTFRSFDGLFDQIVEEHLDKRRKREEGAEEEEEEKDLVDVLLDLRESEGLEVPLTLDNIKAVILDMFAAGTDTTFITLDWAMTELLMNPIAKKSVQDEIRSIVDSKDRRAVAEVDLPQMHYLKAVIKETFRLHPPAPLLVPRESMELVAIDGYEVPANTRIFINAWAIGRDPGTWNNPGKFEPERFLCNNIDYKGQDFELIPFGAGRRGCPAMTFGTVSVEIALAQLLYSFDWELPPGVKVEDLDMAEVFGITMHRTEQLVVVAKPYNL